MKRIKGQVRGFGSYVVSVTMTDGTLDQHRDTNKAEAIASARTYSATNGIAVADVYRTEGLSRVVIEHVGRYENNRHLQVVA